MPGTLSGTILSAMKLLLIALVAVLVLYTVGESLRIYKLAQISKQLIRNAVPYQLESANAARSILVLGDSTAVGVGAEKPADTVAGRVAMLADATSVENYAVSGARVVDLETQMRHAKYDHYQLILIQIGGNDIIAFASAEKAAAFLKEELTHLPKSNQVIVLSAGNVGGAPLFPFFIRPVYTQLNEQYHKAFERVITESGHQYVNLREAPGGLLIEHEPEIYLSADQLHPSSAGYALWYEAIKPHIRLR